MGKNSMAADEERTQLQSIDILHVVQEAHMVSFFICLLFIFNVVNVSLYAHKLWILLYLRKFLFMLMCHEAGIICLVEWQHFKQS